MILYRLGYRFVADMDWDYEYYYDIHDARIAADQLKNDFYVKIEVFTYKETIYF